MQQSVFFSHVWQNWHMVMLCRQHWVEPQQQERPSFLTLNAQQLRRRSVYSHGQSVQPAVMSGTLKSAVAPSEIQAWVERELQAITLEHDVKIVSQVVLRTLAALDQAMGTQGNRYSRHWQLLTSCHLPHACGDRC